MRLLVIIVVENTRVNYIKLKIKKIYLRLFKEIYLRLLKEIYLRLSK